MANSTVGADITVRTDSTVKANKAIVFLARKAHRFYKRWISPLFGDICRFEPYCSDYALQAFEQHGVLRATGLTLWRVLRCNPFCKGGHDPVPAPKS